MIAKDVIIDTNILVDYFKLIYESLNHQLEPARNNQLIRYMDFFRRRTLYIVPQILSETFSLLKSYADRKRTEISFILSKLLDYFQLLNEEYIAKDNILDENNFLRFGFTDIALFLLLNEGNKTLISNDYALVMYCRSRGLNACLPDEIFNF